VLLTKVRGVKVDVVDVVDAKALAVALTPPAQGNNKEITEVAHVNNAGLTQLHSKLSMKLRAKYGTVAVVTFTPLPTAHHASCTQPF
jgi:hypothetical protein